MDSAATLTREYVSASCNRYPNASEWGIEYIAFGSCCSVVLFNVQVCLPYLDRILCLSDKHCRLDQNY